MQPPRKLSMRKSNGEIVESSEDEHPFSTTPTSSSPNSRPISRVSTTNSLHSFLNGDPNLSTTTLSNPLSLPPALQAFKFYFNAFSKSLSPKINLNILDKTDTMIDKLNVIYLSPIEMLLRKLHPNEYYLVKFCIRNSLDFSSIDSSDTEIIRCVQIISDLTESPSSTAKEMFTNFPKQIKGAKISRSTAFNIFGNNFSINNYQFDAEILENINPSEIKIAKDARISLIESSKYDTFDSTEIKEILQTFFKTNLIFHQNDVFSVKTDYNCANITVYFEITFPSIKVSETDPRKTIMIVISTTSIYQQPKIKRLFPNNLFDYKNDFITTDMIELTDKIASILKSQFNPNIDKTENSNAIFSILAGTPGCGMNKLITLLADKLCVNLIKIDCLDFWNIEGKSVEKLVDATVERVKQSSPSLIIVENVKALSDTSSQNNNLDAGNKTLDQLCKSLTENSCNSAVIFTCNQTDLANLPKPLAQMIHFEFIIPDLTEIDRIEFIKFWKEKQKIEIDNENENEKFAALTRGFVLSELDQLITASNHLKIFSQQENFTTEIIEKSIDIRNKSFSTAIGAPKIPTVEWSDVGGLEDVKKAISESLKANLKINNSSSKLKRSGIVLYGPPGCGKTLIAKAVANEFNITFLSVKGPELLNQYVGQSEQNLRMIFEKARLASPSIIFFDEMDSLAPNRGNAGDSGGVMDRMVSQLLTELDTLHSKQNCNVFIMAATNRPDLLDPCLLTPGRFDKSIHVRPAQDLTSKLRILEPVCRKMTLGNGLTPEIIAKKCPEIMSGADITSLMQKTAMRALSNFIYEIEGKKLKGEKEREVIEKAEVIIKVEHVEDALKDFTGSLSTQDLSKYQTIEDGL